MNEIMIYVAFHRHGSIFFDENLYKAIQVGKKNSGINLEIENDDVDDNISHKNHIYSELTGWYWIWKNKKHDYVGTSHYRRFFTIEHPSLLRKAGNLFFLIAGQKSKRHGLLHVNSHNKWSDKLLSSEQAESLLKDFDAVLPVRKKFHYSVYEQYKRRHKEVDIIITRKVIEELQPDYLESFDKTFSSNQMYPFNMFLLPWKLFDEYMAWLFMILFELEKRSDIDLNDKYQKRVCAFMAERLQTVWFNHNNLKIKELNILYFKNTKTAHF